MQAATPGQERVPPVLILVCDNTDIAEVFYRKISGETEVEIVTESDIADVLGDDEEAVSDVGQRKSKSGKRKAQTVYGNGAIFPEYFSNTPEVKRTIRIDTKLLAEAESDDPHKKRREPPRSCGKSSRPWASRDGRASTCAASFRFRC